MKSLRRIARTSAVRGFSLIEMMVVIVIVSIIIAAVLTQVEQTQQRATAEQGKLDQFQAARVFIDQISTDARQMGYPNLHNFDITITPTVAPSCGAAAWPVFLINDCRLAAGLLKITNNQLVFEGDVDGSGSVSIVSYTVNGDGTCANCLERAQVAKITGAAATNAGYLTAALNALAYSAQIQNVQNVNSATNPIFQAYDSTGLALPASMDIGSDPTDIAKARTIQVSLDISDPNKMDPRTHQALEANMTSRLQIVNCSMATTGLATAGGIQLTCQ